MGIRFLCPNGHRLNVKKELAGKVGYCPKCRAKLIIPNVDQAPTKNRDSAVENALADRSSSKKQAEEAALRSNLVAESNVALNDSNVLWFVRALDEREYGPAGGSVIKQWIEERRIAPKMLVWRQGWEKWEEAENVFPEIRAAFEANEKENEQEAQGAEDVLRKSVERLVDSRATSRTELATRKKKATSSFYVILGLIGLIIVLLIILIAILLIR